MRALMPVCPLRVTNNRSTKVPWWAAGEETSNRLPDATHPYVDPVAIALIHQQGMSVRSS
jgi:hypothetical protein